MVKFVLSEDIIQSQISCKAGLLLWLKYLILLLEYPNKRASANQSFSFGTTTFKFMPLATSFGLEFICNSFATFFIQLGRLFSS